VQFSGLHRRVVGILDFLQQFAIVVKQAGDAAVDDQFLDDPNRQVSLASSDLANDQEAFIAPRIAFLREAGRNKVSLLQRRVGARKIGVVVGEFTVLVAARDAGRRQ